MVHYLHKDYLTHEKRFEECERFWAETFEGCSEKAGVRDDWVPFGTSGIWTGNGKYYPPVAANIEFGGVGTVLRRVSPTRNIGLYVTQLDARDLGNPAREPNEGYIETTINSGPWDTGHTTGEVKMLAIRVLPTDELLPKICEIIIDWISPSPRNQEAQS